jgi:hypothetical protein
MLHVVLVSYHSTNKWFQIVDYLLNSFLGHNSSYHTAKGVQKSKIRKLTS